MRSTNTYGRSRRPPSRNRPLIELTTVEVVPGPEATFGAAVGAVQSKLSGQPSVSDGRREPRRAANNP
jgi:hypothetical protein